MKSRPRGMRPALFLVLGLAALLASGTLAYFLITAEAEYERDAPYEAVLEAYAQCLSAGDYEGMYALTAGPVRGGVEQDAFITRVSRIYGGVEAANIQMEALDTVEVTPGDEALGARAIAFRAAMDTCAGRIAFTHSAEVRAYKIEDTVTFLLEWDHDLIFPNLTQDDVVRVETKKGTRGVIYDRGGTMLAGPGLVKSVGLVPEKMREDNAEDIRAIAEILGMSEEAVHKKLNEKWVKPELFVPLKMLAEDDVVRKERLLEIKGIGIRDETARVYPLKAQAAHLTGYIQPITAEELERNAGKGYTAQSVIGKTGLEALLEEQIRGVDGCAISIVGPDGAIKQTLAKIDAVDGEDVTLTIDAALQTRLYEQLKDDKAAAVVMQPYTGEVRALVSTPAYDPNEFVLGVPAPLWVEWNTSENKPLTNRFKATYAPGSSFKPIIAAIGLTTGAFTAEENFGQTGRTWRKDGSWGEYYITTLKDTGSTVNLENAMVNSDNIYFAKAAMKIGAQALADGLTQVGFGEGMVFPFGISASSFGEKGAFASEIELADSGYGQGRVMVSALHMASMYSAFLNEGSMVLPQLLSARDTAYWKENVFSEEAAQIIKNSLIQVVESPNGTAHEVKVAGRLLAGKTGTAEIKESKLDETGTELGWFVGFCADGEAPVYLFVGMVEDVKGRGGSHYVTPIGRAILAGGE